MIDDFLVRAAFAGLGVAAASGPLGSVIIWRRMAFFGDATAHAAILGVALALVLSLPIGVGTFAVALAMGALVAWLVARGHSGDATLGVISHSALAFGLIAISFLDGIRVNLVSFLFGDILTASWREVLFIWLGAAGILALLVWRWPRLLTATLNPDLAISSNISPGREQAVLTIALALLITMALKVVGALLIAAMLIVPAATARSLTRTPESMAVVAGIVAAAAVIGGLALSFWQDTPAGPSIVSVAAIYYAMGLVAQPAVTRMFGR